MARFCPLFSSSKGNCTYIGSARGGILIDAGTSAKRISQTLSQLDIDISSIGAIFVTHEHTDHISALRVFAGAHNIDVYASCGTLAALERQGILTEKYTARPIDSEGVQVSGMLVRPFKTSHDAAESVGYTVVTADGRTVSVATDTGYVTPQTLGAIYGSDLIMLESNHDVGMVQNGCYPYYTKRRILSDIGHLSNDVCAQTAAELLAGGTTRFCLAHLSHDNNMPVLAYQATSASLTQAGAVEGFDYTLEVAGSVPKITVL